MKRIALGLALTVMIAGCVPPPPPIADATLDLTGNWVPAPDGIINYPFPYYRLIVDQGYVLNPFGRDCPVKPSFTMLPPAPFGTFLIKHQWPLSWDGALHDGASPVQEVEIACGKVPLLRLLVLTRDMAILTLADGSALVVQKTTLRAG